MNITMDMQLKDFEFWQGGKDNASKLSNLELDEIEMLLLEWDKQWTDVEINDLFWFEFDTIVQLLGYEDEEDFCKREETSL